MRKILFSLTIVVLLFVTISCENGNAIDPMVSASEPEMIGTPTLDEVIGTLIPERSVSAYTYKGNFSGTFYLQHYLYRTNTRYIFWNATNGVGNKTLWYRDRNGPFPGAWIDLYYRDQSTSWSWRWFDRLIPHERTYWKTRNIYVGNGVVQFRFVLNGQITWHTFDLKMVQ